MGLGQYESVRANPDQANLYSITVRCLLSTGHHVSYIGIGLISSFELSPDYIHRCPLILELSLPSSPLPLRNVSGQRGLILVHVGWVCRKIFRSSRRSEDSVRMMGGAERRDKGARQRARGSGSEPMSAGEPAVRESRGQRCSGEFLMAQQAQQQTRHAVECVIEFDAPNCAFAAARPSRLAQRRRRDKRWDASQKGAENWFTKSFYLANRRLTISCNFTQTLAKVESSLMSQAG